MRVLNRDHLWAMVLFCLLALSAIADPLAVTVSIPPLRSLAERVGGPSVQVTSLMSEHDDPHTFTPSPRAVAAVGNAEVFFTVGMDFERRVCEKLGRMFADLAIVDVSEGLLSEDGDEDAGDGHEHHGHDHHHGHHHGHGHGMVHDPHVWLSIPHLVHMADIMSQAMRDRLPSETASFAERAALVKAELLKTHAAFEGRLRSSRGRTFYVYHPAFGYFAQDYGLVQKSVEIDGKAPSPRQLSTLIRQAREDDVRVIFVQPQFQQRTAHILAERIGGRAVTINPMAPDPLGLLRQAVEALEATAPEE